MICLTGEKDKILNVNKNEILLTLGTKKIQFKKVELKLKDGCFQNVFADKNNKTLSETLEHRRYNKLHTIVSEKYPKFLDYDLGEFLLMLKENKDDNYRLFLNNYGDLEYSIFYIDAKSILSKKGLYAYIVNGKLKYMGRCLDTFKKRINQGYGKIHPKNCYKDGQVTNCHLNSLITKNRDSVSLWVCTMDDAEEIMGAERELIEKYSPEWNIASVSNPIIKTKEWIGGEKTVNVYNGKTTNEQKVIELLSANKDSGYCDDCISYKLNIKPRQQVNQICRVLGSKEDIERIKSTCQICRKLKILNYLK